MKKAKIKKMKRMVPLMMMKAKGLSGPLMTKHAGIKGISKAMGNFKQDEV